MLVGLRALLLTATTASLVGCEYFTWAPGISTTLDPDKVVALSTVTGWGTTTLVVEVGDEEYEMTVPGGAGQTGTFTLTKQEKQGDTISGYAIYGNGVHTMGLSKAGSSNALDDFITVSINGTQQATGEDYAARKLATDNVKYNTSLKQIDYDTKKRTTEVISVPMQLQANFAKGDLICSDQCGGYVVAGKFTGPSISGTISDGTGTYNLQNASFYSSAPDNDPLNFATTTDRANQVAGTYTGKKGDVAVAGSFIGSE